MDKEAVADVEITKEEETTKMGAAAAAPISYEDEVKG
jgi:hypothetical protein